LHIGSLLIAAASYLHAKQAGGRWLVRIEDIDPPREAAGAAADILRTLEAFALHWDGPVLRQSTRGAAYVAAAERLLAEGLAFHCSCSRSEIREADASRYAGTCRAGHRLGVPTSVRVRVEPGVVRFVDGLQGTIETPLDATLGDYVVVRRDGLPAYHLAVVLDDAAQGVTCVVRGVDLLDATAAHVHLQRTLGLPSPRYLHAPVVVNSAGQKLSKQTGAAPVASLEPAQAAAMVLRLLGIAPPRGLSGAPPGELWSWALTAWDVARWQGQRALSDPRAPQPAPPNCSADPERT
jgi:glutamyl-Q tRNA(Asp) synthetase